MRKHRFFTTENLSVDMSIELDSNTSHYINRVLRLDTKDLIYLFNNTGYEFAAIINNITRNTVSVNIINTSIDTLESPLKINLAQVISKGEKMDLVIQKATELGVNTITPVYSERSMIKSTTKLEHWQKIAIAASCQCWRNYVPLINPPQDLSSWIVQANDRNKLILSPNNSSQQLKSLKITNPNITLLIGPEGGFSQTEIDLAIQHDFTPISLGPRILRTETAGIASIAILQAIFGDC